MGPRVSHVLEWAELNADGKHSWVKHADFFALDLVALVIAFVLAYIIRFGDFGFLNSLEWVGLLVIACIINLAISLLINPYSGVFRRTYYEDAMRMAVLALISFVCMGVLLFVFKVGAVYSRLMLGIMYVIYYVLSLIAKSMHKRRLLSRHADGLEGAARRLLVVAEMENLAKAVETALAGDFREYVLTCVSCPSNEPPACSHLWDYDFVCLENMADYVVRSDIDDVLTCTSSSLIDRGDFQRMVGNGVTVHFDLDVLLGIQSDLKSVSSVGTHETLDVGGFEFGPAQLVYLAIKRILDVVIGVVGCAVLAPVALLVKVAYVASGDKSEILYTQERVGLRGRVFKMLKFRTMAPNANEQLEVLLRDPIRRAEWERDQKLENDPRITRMGHVLRKTSIDEFPQFWNILKGDMSLVGPRPLIPGELDSHGGLTLYNKVKPGITGWWACNGRSNISYRERLEMEYHYVRNCSLLLDLTCIARTVLAVVRKEGAR